MTIQDLAAPAALQRGCGSNLYEQVALRITELIDHGTLRPGERVPSVRKCSAQQGVSIATITQAYRLLEDRGLIEARPQSGYYVRVQRPMSLEPEISKPAARAVDVSVSELVMQIIRAARDPNLLRLGGNAPEHGGVPR
jgi:DNA-binding transcriptional regulator YhcF (GntR family)